MKLSYRAKLRTILESILLLFELNNFDTWPVRLVFERQKIQINPFKPLVYISITNAIKHNVLLKERTFLGRLEQTRSMTPIDVNKEIPDFTRNRNTTQKVQINSVSSQTSEICDIVDEINLDRVTADQKATAQNC